MSRRRPATPLAAVLLAACALAPTGCYEHVVSASGPGADRVDVSKPNVPRESTKGALAPRTIELKPLRSRE